MKKYVSCFLFFLVLTAGCLVSLFVLTIDPPRQQAAEVQMSRIRGTAGPGGRQRRGGDGPPGAEPGGSGAGACKGQLLPGGGGGYLIVYDDSLATVNLFTTYAPFGFSAGGKQEKALWRGSGSPPWRKFSAIWNLTPVKTCNLNAGWIY